jgi:COMM domain
MALVDTENSKKNRRVFADLPDDLAEIVRHGLLVIPRIPRNAKDAIMKAIAETHPGTPSFSKFENLAQLANVTVDDISDVLIAISIMMTAITTLADSSDEILFSLRDRELLTSEVREKEIYELLEMMESYKIPARTGAITNRLANETLQSFSDISISVDVRLAIESDTVAATAAVAVVRLDTDNGEKHYFQMSYVQLDQLVEELNAAKKRMGIALEWAKSK